LTAVPLKQEKGISFSYVTQTMPEGDFTTSSDAKEVGDVLNANRGEVDNGLQKGFYEGDTGNLQYAAYLGGKGKVCLGVT